MSTFLWRRGRLTSLIILACSALAIQIQAEEKTSDSSAPRRPNILLAISDDQSFAHTSLAGAAQLQTPGFDRVARSGVWFRNAFAASPGCSPSRAALLTGLHTWQIREAGTHASSFPHEFPVFTDLIAQAGYHVGFTGKGWGPGNWEVSGWPQNPAGKAYSQLKNNDVPQGINKNDYAANFEAFLDQRDDDQPFLFWFGCFEPHRAYKKGIGQAHGKNPDAVDVPGFLPDAPEIRSDLLDYYYEIEWFDSHLVRMLNHLEKIGELENTIVVVTADNGMPFPRAKANCYEYGIHMPLAISWPAQVPGNRTCDDVVSLIDLAPTFLAVASTSLPENAVPFSGQNLLPLLTSQESGRLDPMREAVYSARERHSSSRYNNWTYPQRSIRTPEFLLIRNFRPDRWPAGDPQKYDKPGQLGPMHGGYHDIDACPSLTFLVAERETPAIAPFFQAAVAKRPEFELFDIINDPACMHNLAESPEHQVHKQKLSQQLEKTLQATEDPRILDGGEIFESYPRYSPVRNFPEPPGPTDE